MDSSMLTPGNGSAGFPSAASPTGSLSGAGSASADTHSKLDKLAVPAHETVERLSSVAHHTVDKLAGSAAQVADRFSGQARWMSETPPRLLASSKSWIQEKPLEAVGIALAVGYFMGRMRMRL